MLYGFYGFYDGVALAPGLDITWKMTPSDWVPFELMLVDWWCWVLGVWVIYGFFNDLSHKRNNKA